MIQPASRRAPAYDDNQAATASRIRLHHARDSPQEDVGRLEGLDASDEEQDLGFGAQSQGGAG